MSSTQIHGRQSTGTVATVGSPSHGGRLLPSSSGSRCGHLGGRRGRGGRGGRAAGPRGRSGGSVDGPVAPDLAAGVQTACGSRRSRLGDGLSPRGFAAAITQSEQMPPTAMVPCVHFPDPVSFGWLLGLSLSLSAARHGFSSDGR